MATTEVTDSEFDANVLNSDTLVLVDFWAEWCGPCRQIAPALEELSNEYEGKVKVMKLNIDKNPGTPQKYGVRGIPTMMLFKGGEAIGTKVGALPKSKMAEWVDAATAA